MIQVTIFITDITSLFMQHAQWQRRAEYVKRIRRQAGGGLRSVLFRFQNIDVSHGFNVTFIDGTLEFINTRSNLADPEMTYVRILHVATLITKKWGVTTSMLYP